MTTHWIPEIGRPNARTISGKATLTAESKGTLRGPNPTTRRPRPGCAAKERTSRVVRGWFFMPLRGLSDSLLQGGRRLEAHGLACLYLDGFAGPRVQAFTRLCLAYGEGAEAGKGELARFFQLFDDRVHQFPGSPVGGGAGQFGGILDHLGDKGFRHAGSLWFWRRDYATPKKTSPSIRFPVGSHLPIRGVVATVLATPWDFRQSLYDDLR